MYEVYKKDVTINGVPYRVEPLGGKFLPKLYRVIKKFPKSEPDETPEDRTSKILEALDDEALTVMHELCLETFRQVNPTANEADVDRFVSQNLFKIIPVVLEVNLNNSKDK